MSGRKTFAPEVNTGCEMGQILDHLLCAKIPAIRMEDARAAQRLYDGLAVRVKDAVYALTEGADRQGSTLHDVGAWQKYAREIAAVLIKAK